MTTAPTRSRFDGVPRSELEARLLVAEEHVIAAEEAAARDRRSAKFTIELLADEVKRLGAKLADAEQLRDDYCRNLTATQARSTDLLLENRYLRRLISAPVEEIRVLAEILHERHRQNERFGTPESLADVPDDADGAGESRAQILAAVRAVVAEHCDRTGRATCCWAHVLEEECAEALADGDRRAELIQVAAVAIRIVRAMDARRSQ